MTKVIRGSSLIRNKRYLDLADGFIDIIDPNGWNIINEEVVSPDDPEMHLQMLFKIKDQEEPFEGQLKVPFVIYKSLYEVVHDGDDYVH